MPIRLPHHLGVADLVVVAIIHLRSKAQRRRPAGEVFVVPIDLRTQVAIIQVEEGQAVLTDPVRLYLQMSNPLRPEQALCIWIADSRHVIRQQSQTPIQSVRAQPGDALKRKRLGASGQRAAILATPASVR